MTLNYARTAVLLAALTAILLLLGAAVGGQTGLVVAFVIALVMNAVSLWKSDTIVLRMFNAQEVNEATAPELFQLVRELARRADLPMPRVYVMNNPQPNAFATGRSPSHAAVCASTGLLEALNRRRTRRCSGARTSARQKSGYADNGRCGDHRRRGVDVRPVSAIRHAVRRRPRRRSRRTRNYRHARRCHRCADRSGAWSRWRSAARANIRPTVWAR